MSGIIHNSTHSILYISVNTQKLAKRTKAPRKCYAVCNVRQEQQLAMSGNRNTNRTPRGTIAPKAETQDPAINTYVRPCKPACSYL